MAKGTIATITYRDDPSVRTPLDCDVVEFTLPDGGVIQLAYTNKGLSVLANNGTLVLRPDTSNVVLVEVDTYIAQEERRHAPVPGEVS